MAYATPEKQEQAVLVTAQGRYTELETLRSPALRRAQEASSLTIPSLVPPDGTTDASILPTPYQSVGVRGVNNLAAKLMLALFPPGAAFFKLEIDEFLLDQLKHAAIGAGSTDPTADIDTALSKSERAVMKRFEQKNSRPIISEFLKHLLVAGNGLLYVMPSGAFKFHALANYVCKRDTEGEPLEIIVREGLSCKTLPLRVRAIYDANYSDSNQKKETGEILWLYTWIRRQDNGSWTIQQEFLQQIVPKSQGTYPTEDCPWIAGRWTSISGSDYGRGHCEEYLGDLYSMESSSKSIIEFSANAARLLWLVNEGGVTSRKKIAEAPNGAVIEGDVKDVAALMMDKFGDFQVTKATADDIKQRLEQAFLLNSSVQRQAERVTAEEIRFMAGELEQTLGGNYSTLGQELQLPIVRCIILTLQKQNKFPQLPKGAVNPEIITGLDGLGRTNDVLKLDGVVQGAGQLFGPEAVAEYVNVGAYVRRRAAAFSVDIEGVVRSEQEVQQSRQAAAQQAMEQKTAGPLVKAMSDQSVAASQAQSPQ